MASADRAASLAVQRADDDVCKTRRHSHRPRRTRAAHGPAREVARRDPEDFKPVAAIERGEGQRREGRWSDTGFERFDRHDELVVDG